MSFQNKGGRRCGAVARASETTSSFLWCTGFHRATCILSGVAAALVPRSTINGRRLRLHYRPDGALSGGGGSGCDRDRRRERCEARLDGHHAHLLRAALLHFPPIVILVDLADGDPQRPRRTGHHPAVPEVDIAGERILQSLEGRCPVVPSQPFRAGRPWRQYPILRTRARLASRRRRSTMDSARPPVQAGRPSIAADWSGCYTRCAVRGASLVVPVTLQLNPWPGSSAADGGLEEDFAHDGFTNSQAKTNWSATDFSTPTQSQGTATGNATVWETERHVIHRDYLSELAGYGYAPRSHGPDHRHHGPLGDRDGGDLQRRGHWVHGDRRRLPGTPATPTVKCTGPAVGQSDIGTRARCPARRASSSPAPILKPTLPADYWDYGPGGSPRRDRAPLPTRSVMRRSSSLRGSSPTPRSQLGAPRR